MSWNTKMGLIELTREMESANGFAAAIAEELNRLRGKPIAVSLSGRSDGAAYLFSISHAGVLRGKLIDGGEGMHVSLPFLILYAGTNVPVYKLSNDGFRETYLGVHRQLIVSVASGRIAADDGVKRLLWNIYHYTGQLPEPIVQAFKT